MTDSSVPRGGRTLIARLAYPVRRALAPAALELPRQVHDLARQVEALVGQVLDLAEELGRVRGENDRLRARADELEQRMGAQDGRLDELHDDVLEGRRLNVRIAELTDVVTELVLPLHDRDLNPAALRALRPDTI